MNIDLTGVFILDKGDLYFTWINIVMSVYSNLNNLAYCIKTSTLKNCPEVFFQTFIWLFSEIPAKRGQKVKMVAMN